MDVTHECVGKGGQVQIFISYRKKKGSALRHMQEGPIEQNRYSAKALVSVCVWHL